MKKINSELLKGSTEMLVLKLLINEDLYGYEIIKKMTIKSQGIFNMKQGALYPILHTLEDMECIVSYWEETESARKRKYYHITGKGKELFRDKNEEWNLFLEGINLVLGET